MKTERFTLATASDVVIFDTLVKVIRFDEGSAGGLPVIIKVKSLSGGAYEVELKPGRQITLPELTRGVVISNLSGAALTGKITIGAGMVDDNAVVGEVSVVDGGKFRTLAGSAFLGYRNTSPVAAQYTINQLWNPAGSGKNAIVRAVSISNGSTATAAHIRVTSEQLAGAAGFFSKKSGGAVSTSLSQGVSRAAAPTGDVVFAVYMAAYSSKTLELSEPIVVVPGYGLSTATGTANGLDVPTTFEFYEEPI